MIETKIEKNVKTLKNKIKTNNINSILRYIELI